jgi:UPF0755 protein
MKKIFIPVILFFVFFAFFIWQGIYLSVSSLSQEQRLFNIEKGQGSKEIALNLEKEGLIRWSPLFRFYVATKGVSGKLQAGSYYLSPSMSIPRITEKFVNGEIIKIKLVVPEGYNLKDIEKALFLLNKNSALSFLKAGDFKSEFNFLEDISGQASLEGFLFPDTYDFSYQVSDKEIVQKMLDNFDKKLTSALREEIGKQKKTLFQIITMASMIEKEVKTKEEKEIVSGILWKRLKNKIPLQVDATINYITEKQAGRVLTEETKIDSPYNTYKYLGLPIGPICNPGLESIEAAVYPKNSVYWYYLSTPEGKTIFSRTLEEHNIAKFKYLKNND